MQVTAHCGPVARSIQQCTRACARTRGSLMPARSALFPCPSIHKALPQLVRWDPKPEFPPADKPGRNRPPRENNAPSKATGALPEQAQVSDWWNTCRISGYCNAKVLLLRLWPPHGDFTTCCWRWRALKWFPISWTSLPNLQGPVKTHSSLSSHCLFQIKHLWIKKYKFLC